MGPLQENILSHKDSIDYISLNSETLWMKKMYAEQFFQNTAIKCNTIKCNTTITCTPMSEMVKSKNSWNKIHNKLIWFRIIFLLICFQFGFHVLNSIQLQLRNKNWSLDFYKNTKEPSKALHLADHQHYHIEQMCGQRKLLWSCWKLSGFIIGWLFFSLDFGILK